MLSGELLSSLGACILLDSLKLEGNFFKGAIPRTLEALTALNELDLSKNNLSGQIPEYLVSLRLQVLNLSFNNLEGLVPSGGVFNNETGVSVYGNSGLCRGIPQLKLAECNLDNRGRQSHRIRLIIAILSGVFGISLLVGLVFWFAFSYRNKRKKLKASGENLQLGSLSDLSYQSLLKSTNGFSTENLVGSGTFGAVYKGVLDDDDGKIVAIKVFNLKHHGASESFIAECGVLWNIRPRNLLKVITACLSIDHQGNDFKALVYEYMVNGSLEDCLHPIRAISRVEGRNNESNNLNLFQRLDIAVDIALSLEYLHHRCGTPVVHCDLKPSNVLLDEEMIAHVGDFGLAKFLSEERSNSIVRESSTFGVRGLLVTLLQSMGWEMKCLHMVMSTVSAFFYWKFLQETGPLVTFSTVAKASITM